MMKQVSVTPIPLKSKREEFGPHLEEVKDSALSQKASAKENSERVPDKKKEELQEGHPSSLEETTPEDTTSSAESGVNDDNAQDDFPSNSISHNKEKQNKRRPKKSKARPTQSTLQTPRYNLRRNPNYQTNLPQFTRWQPADSRKLSVLTLVAKTMRMPLTRTEEKPGWLYVYWNQSNSGYRKIGYTTVGIATRLRKWETQCRHCAEQITQSPQREGLQEKKEEEKVPHVRRLEALVHATLKEDRYYEPCCAACHSCHRELVDMKDPHKIQSESFLERVDPAGAV